jgi:hypothetical protein
MTLHREDTPRTPRDRVLNALVEIIQFDDDRSFAEIARRRFNDMHEKKEQAA